MPLKITQNPHKRLHSSGPAFSCQKQKDRLQFSDGEQRETSISHLLTQLQLNTNKRQSPVHAPNRGIASFIANSPVMRQMLGLVTLLPQELNPYLEEKLWNDRESKEEMGTAERVRKDWLTLPLCAAARSPPPPSSSPLPFSTRRA